RGVSTRRRSRPSAAGPATSPSRMRRRSTFRWPRSTAPRRFSHRSLGAGAPELLYARHRCMPRRPRITQLTAAQYDALERAIADGRRLSVWRRGTEYVVVVDRLRLTEGREALEAHHPTTGDRLTLYIDEL